MLAPDTNCSDLDKVRASSALPASELAAIAESRRIGAAKRAATAKRKKNAKPQTYGCDPDEWAAFMAEASPEERLATKEFAKAAELEEAHYVVGHRLRPKIEHRKTYGCDPKEWRHWHDKVCETKKERDALIAFAKAAQRQLDNDHCDALGIPRKTSRHAYLINKADEQQRQAALYPPCPEAGPVPKRYDPHSPLSKNAQQSGLEFFHTRGWRWRGSDVILAETGDERLALINGKYFQYAWVQTVPKTAGDIMLDRIVTAVPALRPKKRKGQKHENKKLLAGPCKDDRREYGNKRSALQMPLISCHRLTTLFRVDIDRNFIRYDDLLSWLQHLVEEGKLPCLPHFVVWIFDDRFPGQVLHPHLIWLLPADRPVWGYGVQRRIYDAVVSQVTENCIEIGADAGGLANPTDFKNPISGHCHYKTPNRTHFPTLSEMAEAIGAKTSRLAAARRRSILTMAEAQMGSDQSNRFWEWCYKVSYSIAIELCVRKEFDPRSDIFDVEVFQRALIEHTIQLIPGPEDGGPRNAKERAACEKAIKTRCSFLAREFDPDRIGKGKDLGACADLMPAKATRKERHEVGGRYGRTQASKNIQAEILEAYRRALKEGLPTTKVAIAEAAGCSRNTVRAHQHLLNVAQQELAGQEQTITQGPIEVRAENNEPFKVTDYSIRIPDHLVVTTGYPTSVFASLGCTTQYREGVQVCFGPNEKQSERQPTAKQVNQQRTIADLRKLSAIRRTDHRLDWDGGYGEEPAYINKWGWTASPSMQTIQRGDQQPRGPEPGWDCPSTEFSDQDFWDQCAAANEEPEPVSNPDGFIYDLTVD